MNIDPVERHLFLEGIFLRYGYDFRQYAEISLNRRLVGMLARKGSDSLLDVLKETLASPEFFRQVLAQLTINTTEFFRDPLFFKALRESVFPLLRTYPSLRIWIAGCSTGQEILSLAILLDEDGLLKRSTIYATDINSEAIKQAREGIYNIGAIQTFAKNYSMASGLKSPSDYYTADYDLIRFHRRLSENIVFSEHNLATDSAFTEAHLILCRNVLIYFSRALQDRALTLFTQSLVSRGFLAIGSKESLKFSSVGSRFTAIDKKENVHQFKNLDQGGG